MEPISASPSQAALPAAPDDIRAGNHLAVEAEVAGFNRSVVMGMLSESLGAVAAAPPSLRQGPASTAGHAGTVPSGSETACGGRVALLQEPRPDRGRRPDQE